MHTHMNLSVIVLLQLEQLPGHGSELTALTVALVLKDCSEFV